MDYQKQAAVTQPVRVLRTEGVEFLIHTDTEAEVLEGIRHLQPVTDWVRNRAYDRSFDGPVRVLLLSEDAWISRQAALALLTFRGKQSAGMQGKAAQQKDELFRQFEAIFEPFSEAVEEEKEAKQTPFEAVDWERDLLVLSQRDLCAKRMDDQDLHGYIQDAMQQMMQMPAAKSVEALAKNVFIDCFRDTPDDQLVDAVADMEKDTIIISMPDRESMRYYLKRFSFEEGFQMIRIRKPEKEYYAQVLKAYLEVCGVAVPGGIKLPVLVQKLMSYRGSLFHEQDIFRLADFAMGRSGKNRLRPEDFYLYGEKEEQKGLDKLNRLIGLANVKRTIRGIMAMQKLQSEHSMKEIEQHRNLAFAGPPGTGKSVVARIYGEIMAELGISNGKFISAGRKDMVGRYLGHTAAKMDDLFRRAEGGVLFIDEAGTLTADDDFTKECVTELVRYMEEQPQTTVIFATYPSEMDALLKSDPGFSSRIRKVVRFESYTDRELWEIFRSMAAENGLVLADGTEEAVYVYIEECRRCRGKAFGNAREMRRLMEMAAEMYSLRLLEDGTGSRNITAGDICAARRELLAAELPDRMIGFGMAVRNIPGNQA